MNPVLILTRNNLKLTKKCVESVIAQDLGDCHIALFDNASTDGTVEWAERQPGFTVFSRATNAGVSVGWNVGLRWIFDNCRSGHALVVNNDTILPPWFHRTLLGHDTPFVSGVSVDRMSAIATPPPRHPLRECPDFSAFLIRRDCWEKVGPFDERLVHYCGDMDYHIRAHRLGIPLMNAAVPFYHERSSTLNHSIPDEQREIQAQADKDRATFRSIHGFGANDPQYEEVFKEKLYGKY